ncbi:hypothetical protein GCM10007304_29000 [Rhodococcoides trifolii]|uniref:YbaB/EbfC DNA-binding family protein n=1 Tax=Rhodococcoides trifolii TaxID=908250 RepID=A0A917D8N4_9NOCA|nr:hypothetical protein [Rhodococcus trifolii]GGG13214.1 hypothetical protein GCM10007304_29000 [Rhodococcus trifolii]
MTEARASNAGGTVRVRATETGVLVGLHIERSELRFGGDALAATILSVCSAAAHAAAQRHRAALLRDGLAPEVVDRVAPAGTAPTSPPGRWTLRP